MNGRLGIISGAAFAGVVGAAILIGGVPGFGSGDDSRDGGSSNASAGALVPITDSATTSANSSTPGIDAATETLFTQSGGSGSHEAQEHSTSGKSHDSHDDGEEDDD